jgi:hypothetical protein
MRTSIIIAVLLSVAGTAHGQVLATCGFNDVFGINGDGIANNLPYNIQNASLTGQGSVDPGFSSWLNAPFARVVNSGQFEGDGAAFFPGTTGAFGERLFATGTPFTPPPFRVSVRVKLDSVLAPGTEFSQELNNNHFGFRYAAWTARSDGHFWVANITGNSIDTGFTYTPGTYHAIEVLANFPAHTLDFFFDGVHFNNTLTLFDVPQFTTPNGLLFGLSGATTGGVFVDALTVIQEVPEPSSLALLGAAVCGFSWQVIRRRVHGAAG